MTKKPLNTKKTYKMCKNCRTRTDSPAWIGTKLVCQKCALYHKSFKKLPDKKYIKHLKENGLWKK